MLVQFSFTKEHFKVYQICVYAGHAFPIVNYDAAWSAQMNHSGNL